MLSNQNASIVNRNFAQATILVIEDNDDIWMIVSMMLRKKLPELTVHRVANAQQALDCLETSIAGEQPFPKLILQNLYLPALKDGLDLLQEIRSKLTASAAQQIPILVMSSSDNTEDIRKAYQAGATSFYGKPTALSQWGSYFELVRLYWWETVILPAAY